MLACTIFFRAMLSFIIVSMSLFIYLFLYKFKQYYYSYLQFHYLFMKLLYSILIPSLSLCVLQILCALFPCLVPWISILLHFNFYVTWISIHTLSCVLLYRTLFDLLWTVARNYTVSPTMFILFLRNVWITLLCHTNSFKVVGHPLFNEFW